VEGVGVSAWRDEGDSCTIFFTQFLYNQNTLVGLIGLERVGV
jgi:hypothetical protein